MTYQELFEQVKMKFRKADVSGVKEHLAFQFNITGEAAGSFYAEVRDGELYVEPYEYHDRVAAFTLGRLKVDGDIGKALMLQKFL